MILPFTLMLDRNDLKATSKGKAFNDITMSDFRTDLTLLKKTELLIYAERHDKWKVMKSRYLTI